MDKSIERIISILLLELGFKPHHRGYRYARTAIEMVMIEPSILHGKVTSEIYTGVAKIHNTTPARVDGAIRFSIETAFGTKSQKWNRIIKHFHYNQKAPSNSFFLAQCAEVLQLDLAS